MKIALFTNSYFPLPNGVSRSVFNFKRGLERLGHEVHVVVPDVRGYKDKEANIFRYPSLSWQYKIKYPIPFTLSGRANARLRELQLDIIHSQNPWGLGRLALRLARKHKTPILFTNHTMYSLYANVYLPRIAPKRLIVNFVERGLVRYANRVDGVIAPTVSIKEYLERLGVKTKIYVVPSGIDFSEIENAPDIKVREKYSIPEGDHIIFNGTRMGPEKNPLTVLRAHKLVLAKMANVTLMMVGPGPSLEELRQQARAMGIDKKTVFVGAVEPHLMGSYYKAADVFAHASLTETQGLVLIEAMAARLPIAAVKANGVKDIIKDGQSGLLVANKPEELADATLRLLSDIKLRKNIIAGAKEAAQIYTVEHTSLELAAVYKQLTKKPNSSSH